MNLGLLLTCGFVWFVGLVITLVGLRMNSWIPPITGALLFLVGLGFFLAAVL